MDTTAFWHAGWRFSPLMLPILLTMCDAPLTAEARAATDPAAIDRAVAAFTGAAIGTPGGARMASDPRLQLAACTGPLAVSWHGAARSSVEVVCAGPTAWRIFVAVNPVANPARAARETPAIKRGDALTIVVRGRGFSVQQQGEAIEGGAVGD
ncbi:MAG: flagellar protein, partial [Erythrobacter sp.]